MKPRSNLRKNLRSPTLPRFVSRLASLERSRRRMEGFLPQKMRRRLPKWYCFESREVQRGDCHLCRPHESLRRIVLGPASAVPWKWRILPEICCSSRSHRILAPCSVCSTETMAGGRPLPRIKPMLHNELFSPGSALRGVKREIGGARFGAIALLFSSQCGLGNSSGVGACFLPIGRSKEAANARYCFLDRLMLLLFQPVSFG